MRVERSAWLLLPGILKSSAEEPLKETCSFGRTHFNVTCPYGLSELPPIRSRDAAGGDNKLKGVPRECLKIYKVGGWVRVHCSWVFASIL